MGSGSTYSFDLTGVTAVTNNETGIVRNIEVGTNTFNNGDIVTDTPARTFKIGLTGLATMKPEDGNIQDLSTDAGQVAVVAGTTLDIKAIPGFEQTTPQTDQTYSNTPDFS